MFAAAPVLDCPAVMENDTIAILVTLGGGQLATLLTIVMLFSSVNERFDEMSRDMSGLRERMAKLEGSLDGFLAGRRDSAAA